MSIFFGLLLARRFYCRSALSFSPGITGGFLPRINAPSIKTATSIDVTVFLLSVNKRFDLLAQKHGDYHLRTVKRNVGNNSRKKSLL